MQFEACTLCCSDVQTFLDCRIAHTFGGSDALTFLDSSVACALWGYFRVMSTLQKYPSPYLFTIYLTSTSLWPVFLLQPFYYGPRLMHAQTTQDQQPQSSCNHYQSGPVSVFLPVAQPDFKSLFKNGPWCCTSNNCWHISWQGRGAPCSHLPRDVEHILVKNSETQVKVWLSGNVDY